MSWTGNTVPHGTESAWKPCEPTSHCRQCKKQGVVEYTVWDSSCGGYTDYHYRCTACGHDWWIDGPDA